MASSVQNLLHESRNFSLVGVHNPDLSGRQQNHLPPTGIVQVRTYSSPTLLSRHLGQCPGGKVFLESLVHEAVCVPSSFHHQAAVLSHILQEGFSFSLSLFYHREWRKRPPRAINSTVTTRHSVALACQEDVSQLVAHIPPSSHAARSLSL